MHQHGLITKTWKESQNNIYIMSLLLYLSKASKLYTIFLHDRTTKKEKGNDMHSCRTM